MPRRFVDASVAREARFSRRFTVSSGPGFGIAVGHHERRSNIEFHVPLFFAVRVVHPREDFTVRLALFRVQPYLCSLG
jgi:hypothetical protein